MSDQNQEHIAPTPTELSGGAGFNFEDHVAAFFLVSLLAQERLLAPSSPHKVDAVHWQVKNRGWILDDLLLSLEGNPDADDNAYLALSVKRDRKVTQKGFSADIVRSVWLQWLDSGKNGSEFDRKRDFLGLAVGKLAESVLQAWYDLLNYALHRHADEMVNWLSNGGSNKIVRALFESLRCPDEVLADRQAAPSKAETVRLIRRFRLFGFDLDKPVSWDVRDRLKLVQHQLVEESSDQARELWQDLQMLAFSRRPAGGDIDRVDLLDELRTQYQISEALDFRGDWRRIAQISEEARSRAGAYLAGRPSDGEPMVGPRLTLLRADAYRRVLDSLGTYRVTWLAGEGGTGKSGLGHMVAARWKNGRTVWLDADVVGRHGLAGLGSSLQLSHSVERLIREDEGQRSLLVLDGLDRWEAQAVETAAQLISACSQTVQWSVLIITRVDRLGVLQQQIRNRYSKLASSEPVMLEPLGPSELADIHEVFPWLAKLAERPSLEPFLRKLQVMQFLLSAFPRHERGDAVSWASESDVIDELWAQWTGTDKDQYARAGLLKRLGALEAENRFASVGLVAKSILGGGEGMIEVVYQRAYRERDRLGCHWRQLQNLAVLWSCLRSVASRWEPEEKLLGSWAKRLGKWFSLAKLPTGLVDWERCADAARRVRARLHGKEAELYGGDEFYTPMFPPVRPQDTGLDLMVMKAAFSWLPSLGEARDQGERDEWISLHLLLLSVATHSRLRIETEEYVDGHHVSWLSGVVGDFEQWVLGRVAALVPQLGTPEARRAVWSHVMDPSLAASRHAADFMRSWFIEGRQAAENTRQFVVCWSELIQFVKEFRENWRPGDRGLRLDDNQLLGLEWGANEVGKEEYHEHMGSLYPHYEWWAARNLKRPESATLFARFLAKAGAQDLVRPGIKWIHEALPSIRAKEDLNNGFADAICSALTICWRRHQFEVRGDDEDLSCAFFDLLAWACSENHPPALELRASIGI